MSLIFNPAYVKLFVKSTIRHMKFAIEKIKRWVANFETGSHSYVSFTVIHLVLVDEGETRVECAPCTSVVNFRKNSYEMTAKRRFTAIFCQFCFHFSQTLSIMNKQHLSSLSEHRIYVTNNTNTNNICFVIHTFSVICLIFKHFFLRGTCRIALVDFVTASCVVEDIITGSIIVGTLLMPVWLKLILPVTSEFFFTPIRYSVEFASAPT